MDMQSALLVLFGLLFVAYPLHYLMHRPTRGRRRLLGYWLVFFAAAGIAWPGLALPGARILAALLGAAGFALAVEAPRERMLLLLPLAYGLILLVWPEPLPTVAVVAGALLFTVGAAAVVRSARNEAAASGGGHD